MSFSHRIGVAILALLPVVVMAFVLQDFVREVLIGPIFYAYWVVRLFLGSIPQVWEWVAFVLLVAYIVARSLVTLPSLPRRRQVEPVEHGRVEDLARLLQQAHGDAFARWRVAQRLGGLVGDVLADAERVSQREIWRRLDRGQLDVPPSLRAYLTARFQAVGRSNLRGFRAAPSPLDLEPREVVQFLEDQIRRT